MCHDSKCRKRGAARLVCALRQEVEAQGLGGHVEVRSGGCNDLCKRAPSISVQPDRIWYAELTPEKARTVVQRHLAAGEPVREWVAKDKSPEAKAARKAAKQARKQAKAREKSALADVA